MAATVAALAVLTFVAPQETPAQQAAASEQPYTAESVILDESDASEDQMSYGQVFTTLYESDDEAAR
jgi:hypothetical protein